MHRAVRLFIDENVPDGLADKVAALVRPCVTAGTERCADDTIPVGGSKFGGRPDVPARFEWPRYADDAPCWFVAQVRLADLRPFDTGLRLPRVGRLLSFFYHDHRGTAGRGSRVFAFPLRRLRRADIVPDPQYGGQAFHDRHFYPRSLHFSQGYCLPADPGRYRLTAAERGRWDWPDLLAFKESFHARFARGRHQVFGQPPYSTPPRGYQLLARFGEVSDSYHYFVPSGRAEALDFTRLRVTYDCS